MLCNTVKTFAVVIGAVWITISAYAAWSSFFGSRKKYIEEKAKYEEAMRDYSRKQAQWKYQVSFWQQESEQVQQTYETSLENRAKIYAVGVLAPKYRNFELYAVCLNIFKQVLARQ